MPQTDPNETPDFLETPWIINLRFPRISSLAQATLSSILLLNGHSNLDASSTEVTPLLS
jgi:hypothetical protein